MKDIGTYTIGINKEALQEYLIGYIEEQFSKNGWKSYDSDDAFLVIKKEKELLAFSINIGENVLKDYFALRGWARDYPVQSFILVSSKFDKFISLYKDKDVKCLLADIQDIFTKNFTESIIEEVKRRTITYAKEKAAEEVVEIDFKNYGELPKLLENITNLLKSLPANALQRGPGSASKKGNKFQKDIVSLLNLTILRTKYAGGQNQPDGIGLIMEQGGGKSKWFPIEIKTFTSENDTECYYPLKNVIGQIDKYSITLLLAKNYVNLLWFWLHCDSI